MKIIKLEIEGFRSLKSQTWCPGDLNVLIGPERQRQVQPAARPGDVEHSRIREDLGVTCSKKAGWNPSSGTARLTGFACGPR